MSNRIGKLVKEIQYNTDLTIEQIADKINYSRSHLNRLAKNGDSEKLFQRLMGEFGDKIAQNVPRGTPESPQTPPELITSLLVQQNNLMAILTDVIKDHKKGLIDRVETIDANLKAVLGQGESLKYDLVSGREVVLKALSRLEGKKERVLLDQADNIAESLAVAKNERYKKAATGR